MIRSLSCLLLASATLGCGGGADRRVPLSGTVTYNGQPIPVGTLMFDPDASRGNTQGMQGSADIVDGRFQTLKDFGPQQGAYIVRVYGFDGKATPELPQGNSICLDARIPVEIDSNSTLNIDVPAAR